MLGQLALGKYRLLRSLGQGSNAEVFLAEPTRYPGRRVVVKRIHDHVVAHPKFRQLFEAEVRSMADFVHPFAVRFLEATLDDPLGPCLVLEYVPGITLETLIARHFALSVERTGRLLGILCHALQAAHDCGTIHRDLKPANIMVTKADSPDESLKVMDFGFAGFAAKPHLQLAELTGHGPIYAIGTPGYVSPEMIRGDRVDSRSDLYSVGVMLFEMLTGQLPFSHDTQDQLLAAHVRDIPPTFHQIGCGEIPAGVEASVRLALSKYPNERPQSARELAEQFGQCFAENYWKAVAPTDWKPISRSAAMIVLEPEDKPAEDPFRLTHRFDVMIPERLAAAKLRGFVDDIDGQFMASEPGVVRIRFGVPEGFYEIAKPRTGLIGWLTGTQLPWVPRGQEPIELTLHMDKPDPSHVLLNVVAEYSPMQEYRPREADDWRTRCDKLNLMLRQYLGA